MESRLMLAAEGTFNAQHPLTVQDPRTANNATFAMTGPGSGTLTVGANGIWNLALENTTRSTIVTVGGQEVEIEQITATRMVGAVVAPKVDWVAASTGSHASTMDFQGGILKLQLDNLSSMDGVAHTLTIGAGGRATDATVIILRDANDLAIESLMPISSFTASSYIAHGDYRPNVHTSGYFGAISVAHDVVGVATVGLAARPIFQAEMPNPSNAKGIASIVIGGNITGTRISTDAGNVGPITVRGTMDGATIYTSNGSLGKATVGGSMINRAELHSNNGNFAGALVAGNVDDSRIYASGIGNLGAVSIGGNVTNNSLIHAGSIGALSTVTITGTLDNSDVYTSSGNIALVSVGRGMTDSATIRTGDGNLKAVVITGDVSGDSSIYVGGTGVLSGVTIKGSLNGSNVYTTAGNLTRVSVGGSVTNGAEIRASSGNIGSILIAGNLDGSSSVDLGRSTTGLGKIAVGGNVGGGVTIDVSGGKIGTATIAGGILGTGPDRNNRVSVAADGGITSLTVGQGTNYLHVGSAYGPIMTVKIAGVMRNSDISSDNGITIGSVTVGQLDNSRISVGLVADPPTGQRSDFEAAGTITSVLVRGIVTGGIRNFMTNDSVIASWFMGKVTFAAKSTGSGIIEAHTGTVINAPVDAAQQSLWTVIE